MARPPRVNSGSGSGTPSRAANKGGIIALDLLWPRINARTDAEREFGTPVLTEVPNLTRAELRDRGIHHLSRSRLASFREAHRMLRTSILLIGSADDQSPDGVVGAGEPLLVSGPQVMLIRRLFRVQGSRRPSRI